MWRCLEDNRELRRVLLKGWGLDGRKLEIKHESQVCLSEGLVSSCVETDELNDQFCCLKWQKDKTLALELIKGKGNMRQSHSH